MTGKADAVDISAYLGDIARALVNPDYIFSGTSWVPRLCLILFLVAGAIGLVIVVVRRASGGQRSGFLAFIGRVAPWLGIASAAYGLFNLYMGIQQDGALTEPQLYTVSLDLFYSLVPALVVWLIARFGNAGAKAG